MFSVSTIIAMLETAVQVAPDIINTVENIVSLGTKLYESLNGTPPTAADIADIRAQVDASETLALTPMPDDPPAAS